jgi:hypothetical protein
MNSGRGSKSPVNSNYASRLKPVFGVNMNAATILAGNKKRNSNTSDHARQLRDLAHAHGVIVPHANETEPDERESNSQSSSAYTMHVIGSQKQSSSQSISSRDGGMKFKVNGVTSSNYGTIRKAAPLNANEIDLIRRNSIQVSGNLSSRGNSRDQVSTSRNRGDSLSNGRGSLSRKRTPERAISPFINGKTGVIASAKKIEQAPKSPSFSNTGKDNGKDHAREESLNNKLVAETEERVLKLQTQVLDPNRLK